MRILLGKLVEYMSYHASSRGPPLLKDLTISVIVPDWLLPGDFNNLWGPQNRALPGGLNAAIFVGAVQCEMPFLLALKAHYLLLIPELFSRDICSRLY